jgi:hypothetical protein
VGAPIGRGSESPYLSVASVFHHVQLINHLAPLVSVYVAQRGQSFLNVLIDLKIEPVDNNFAIEAIHRLPMPAPRQQATEKEIAHRAWSFWFLLRPGTLCKYGFRRSVWRIQLVGRYDFWHDCGLAVKSSYEGDPPRYGLASPSLSTHRPNLRAAPPRCHRRQPISR